MKGMLSWTLLKCAWMRGVGYRAQAARPEIPGHATLVKVAGVPADASLAWEAKGCPVLPKLRVDELPGPSPPREKDGIQMLADMVSFGSAHGAWRCVLARVGVGDVERCTNGPRGWFTAQLAADVCPKY